MANNAKLKVVRTQNHEQTFGQGTTPYATFTCETENNDLIPVGLSHNMLRSIGVPLALIDDLVGCTLVIKDDVDIKTGEIRRVASERVLAVVEKRPKSSILLVNQTNAELIKSELLRDAVAEFEARVAGNVKVVEDKERRLARARARAQQLEAELNSTPTATANTSDASDDIAQSTAEAEKIVADAQLEQNEEELPFG